MADQRNSASQIPCDSPIHHAVCHFPHAVFDSHENLPSCIYFLDPDKLVTPPFPAVGPHGRPPNTPATAESPAIFMDQRDITVIRQLAERVNVLPVVAKADGLTTERLATIKQAIRRDLADAGIGFGIFDRYRPTQPPASRPAEDSAESSRPQNGFSGPRPLSNVSPTSPPEAPSIAGMPYTLISPDLFDHSDGVLRTPPTRTELMQHYASSSRPSHTAKNSFTRAFRWGTINILDPNHCDFSLVKYAVFLHLQVSARRQL